MKEYPFVYGAQYYRAPTPEKANWEKDMKNMKEMGLNRVKFWVQWRWTHRAEDEFYFDDLDELMDIAHKNSLKVTLNTIFDVAPTWLYKKYPDAKQILADGTVIEPRVIEYRQIGGFPGPCYNHEKAKEMRMRFMEETVKHFCNHPALEMWDVWNEPEQCGTNREPIPEKVSCHCPSCRKKFIDFLKNKYKSLETLNEVWGRCYLSWEDVELPKNTTTVTDFMDFCNFKLDTMTGEAKWRIDIIKKYDKVHKTYLHVVPNTSAIFNAVTGVDDFEMAKLCDVFASTNFAKPIWSILTASAGKEKVCYNVECHIGGGSMEMHQKPITYDNVVGDFVPQMGLGLRGFMFWQYRAEILGKEAPAWGMTAIDGTEGTVGKAAREFISKFKKYEDIIMECKKPKAEIAVWKGRTNELFSYSLHNNLEKFAKSIENLINLFYYNNFECCVCDDNDILGDGLKDIKLLVLPQCYAMTRNLTKKIYEFIKNGGTVICEAHFGGYDVDRGRHSYAMPGCGGKELFGIYENYTTSSYHIQKNDSTETVDVSNMNDDVKKALDAYGVSGGKHFSVAMNGKYMLMGSDRFAQLEGEDIEVLGSVNGKNCVISKKVGMGKLYYCGTDIAESADIYPGGIERFIFDICKERGIERTLGVDIKGVHIDIMKEGVIAVNNTTDKTVTIPVNDKYFSVFYENKQNENIVISPKTADIFIKEK